MDTKVSTIAFRRLAAFARLVRDDAERDLAFEDHEQLAPGRIDIAYERLRAQNGLAAELISLLQDRQHALTTLDDNLSREFESLRDSYGVAHGALSAKAIEGAEEDRTSLLNELAEVHNKLNTMAWLTGELESDNSRSLPGSYDSADKMFAAIGL